MKWLERNGMHLSAPYRLYHSVRGWEAWIWTKHGGACLGREMSVEKAKEACAQHKAKETA